MAFCTNAEAKVILLQGPNGPANEFPTKQELLDNNADPSYLTSYPNSYDFVDLDDVVIWATIEINPTAITLTYPAQTTSITVTSIKGADTPEPYFSEVTEGSSWLSVVQNAVTVTKNEYPQAERNGKVRFWNVGQSAELSVKQRKRPYPGTITIDGSTTGSWSPGRDIATSGGHTIVSKDSEGTVIDYSTSSSQEWASFSGGTFSVPRHYWYTDADSSARTATITFTNIEDGTATYTITQAAAVKGTVTLNTSEAKSNYLGKTVTINVTLSDNGFNEAATPKISGGAGSFFTATLSGNVVTVVIAATSAVDDQSGSFTIYNDFGGSQTVSVSRTGKKVPVLTIDGSTTGSWSPDRYANTSSVHTIVSTGYDGTSISYSVSYSDWASLSSGAFSVTRHYWTSTSDDSARVVTLTLSNADGGSATFKITQAKAVKGTVTVSNTSVSESYTGGRDYSTVTESTNGFGETVTSYSSGSGSFYSVSKSGNSITIDVDSTTSESPSSGSFTIYNSYGGSATIYVSRSGKPKPSQAKLQYDGKSSITETVVNAFDTTGSRQYSPTLSTDDDGNSVAYSNITYSGSASGFSVSMGNGHVDIMFYRVTEDKTIEIICTNGYASCSIKLMVRK